MFLDITADNWALLWSAVIGALIAGGSAAGVALWVLGKTREDQAVLAKTQLDAQRADLELQLTEQREGLDLQLREQRAEASKSRELPAISAMIAAVNEYALAPENANAIVPMIREKAFAAAFRWAMEQDDLEHLGGTMAHISLLGDLAYQAAEESLANPHVFASSFLALSAAISEVMTRWAAFPNANEVSRADHYRWLADRSQVAAHVREAP